MSWMLSRLRSYCVVCHQPNLYTGVHGRHYLRGGGDGQEHILQMELPLCPLRASPQIDTLMYIVVPARPCDMLVPVAPSRYTASRLDAFLCDIRCLRHRAGSWIVFAQCSCGNGGIGCAERTMWLPTILGLPGVVVASARACQTRSGHVSDAM